MKVNPFAFNLAVAQQEALLNYCSKLQFDSIIVIVNFVFGQHLKAFVNLDNPVACNANLFSFGKFDGSVKSVFALDSSPNLIDRKFDDG